MSSLSVRIGKPFVWTFFIYVFIAVVAVPAFGECARATRVDLGASFRSFGLEAPEVFEVEVPASGVLAVEATAPLGDAAQPKLALLDHGCRVTEVAGKGRIATYVAGRVLEAPFPGTYRFAVAPQDPSAPLGAFRLVTRFASWAEICGGAAAVPKTLVEPEREPDLAVACAAQTRLLAKTLVEPEREPDLGKTLVEPEREPDLFALLLAASCRPEGDDDHGDDFACATRLVPGRSENGRLANVWGDDADVFRFRVDRQKTVAIEWETDGEIALGLYDARGHRLALPGDSFHRRVVTLGAGSYHLRLASATGGEAAYRLTVTEAGW